MATSAEDVYDHAVRFAWEDVLPVDGYFSVVSSVDTPSIRNSQYANVKLKDAVVDRLRRVYGKRPDTGPLTNAAVLFLYWKQSSCIVYLDTSGVPLSRRGYRVISQQAPLNEVLAAAIVKASRWTPDEVFVNPMCGSGTLAIEAALAGTNTPSQFLRTNFGFMHTRLFDGKSWNEMRSTSMAAVSKRPLSIIATDHKVSAVHATRKNATAAGILDMMDVRVSEFRATPVPEGTGVVILNPEYGERMGAISHLEELYSQIGDWFKKSCTGKRAYVFTGNVDLAKKVGLRTSRRIPMYNGDIECRLCEYEMYQGTKRVSEAPTSDTAGSLSTPESTHE